MASFRWKVRKAQLNWQLCAPSLERRRVPGRTAREADNNFALYFRESLSVVTNAYLQASAIGDLRILIYEPPVKLQRKHADPLYLSIVQTYKVVKGPDGYKANTTSYQYSASTKRGDAYKEILAFHWHPDTTPNLKWPHVHINGFTDDGDFSHAHIPTGRMCIEDFIRMLIRDFGVKARMPYDEWKKMLVKNKAAFVGGASWLYWKPLI
jgi:hypothetical protein